MAIKSDKFERSLGGIAEMKKTPNLFFIIDTNIEALAVWEALKLNIPIVAIIDTNSDPTGITYPIPGNDAARRAINLYCELIKQTILDAQKNITAKESKDTPTQKEDQTVKIKDITENVAKEKADKPLKKTKSIFEKIKKLTSAKSKSKAKSK